MGGVTKMFTGSKPKRDSSQDRIIAAQEEQLSEARAERERVEGERAARKRRIEGGRTGLAQLAFGEGRMSAKLGAGTRS